MPPENRDQFRSDMTALESLGDFIETADMLVPHQRDKALVESILDVLIWHAGPDNFVRLRREIKEHLDKVLDRANLL